MSDTLDDVRLWLRYAQEDLEAARLLVGREVPRHPCWLAQQAAEKALKAALISEATLVPHTHDLERLLGLLPDHWEVRRLDVDFGLLSARYPDDLPDLIDRAAAEAAVAGAARVVGAVYDDLLPRLGSASRSRFAAQRSPSRDTGAGNARRGDPLTPSRRTPRACFPGERPGARSRRRGRAVSRLLPHPPRPAS